MAHKRIRTMLVAATGLLATACSSDPAFWDAMAQGLDQAAADLEYQNANCYWAPPPGLPYGAVQQYCPGDYAYRDIYIPPESPYWRERRHGGGDGGHRRDRDDRGHGHGRRGK